MRPCVRSRISIINSKFRTRLDSVTRCASCSSCFYAAFEVCRNFHSVQLGHSGAEIEILTAQEVHYLWLLTELTTPKIVAATEARTITPRFNFIVDTTSPVWKVIHHSQALLNWPLDEPSPAQPSPAQPSPAHPIPGQASPAQPSPAQPSQGQCPTVPHRPVSFEGIQSALQHGGHCQAPFLLLVRLQSPCRYGGGCWHALCKGCCRLSCLQLGC